MSPTFIYHLLNTPYCPKCRRPHAHEPSVEVDGTRGCSRCLNVALDWQQGLSPSDSVDLSPYQYLLPPPNPMLCGDTLALHTLLRRGYCDPDSFQRYIAPAVAVCPAPSGEHFGELKKRYSFDMLCTAVHDLPMGDFGPQFLAVFLDDQKRTFVWRSGENMWCEVGTRHQFKGTVKAHTLYSGVRQTRLSVCKENKKC